MQATYQVYLPQGGPLGEKLRFSWLDDDDVKVGDPRSVAGAGLQWEGENESVTLILCERNQDTGALMKQSRFKSNLRINVHSVVHTGCTLEAVLCVYAL